MAKIVIDPSSAAFVGTTVTDHGTLERLPRDCSELLTQVNGCVLYGGGLHIRGACYDPEWHSLCRAWCGDDALASRYRSILAQDIPVAQNFLGDQFVLRSGSVLRLNAETGEIFDLNMGWLDFLAAAQNDPTEFLSLRLLHEYESTAGMLQPGYLLSVYPPLCTKEAAAGVSLRAVPVMERLRLLADFAAQIASVADGDGIRIIVK